MKHNFLIIITISLLGFLTACNATQDYKKIVDMPDLKVEKGKAGNEVVFDDSKLENHKEQVSTFGEVRKDQNYTDKDGSSIRISYDAYGNKTETRYFFDHPNLKYLIVTESTDGTKEGLVFGHNNEHKKLSPEIVDKALTASGYEIASDVGITSTKRESSSPTVVRTTQPTQVYPRMPDPRLQPVTQPQEINTEEQTEPENQTVEQNPDTNEKKKDEGIEN